MAELASAFFQSLVAASSQPTADVVALEVQLAQIVDEARQAHPELPFDPLTFVSEVGSRVSIDDDGVGKDPIEALTDLRPGDLHLACACARGDSVALRLFDRLYGPDLDLAIQKSPGLGMSGPEFRSLVHEKLFVAEPGKTPRIASYSGKGSLRGWVRVTGARTVVDLARRVGPVEKGRADAELIDRLPGETDPELAYLRHAYGAALPEVFAVALGGLSPRQRNLLRQRYLHELGADQLAQLYRVHRATAFGWLEDARKELLAQVRIGLAQRIPGHELESVLDLVGSKLDVSVRRMLDSQVEDEPARR